MQTERTTIVEFLASSDPDMDFNPNAPLGDLIDLVIDRANEMELDYTILSTAFLNKVNPDRFEDFHEAVMRQYEMVRDGEEIPESTLDRIAASYR